MAEVDISRTSDIAAPVPLTQLVAGEGGRLHTADLVRRDREMLFALGLSTVSRFRLCKAGNPWIVQIRGTRVGLSEEVAGRLLVVRDPAPRQRTPEGHA